jgi:hypothetical protein
MQAEEALYAATREGSLSGTTGQGDERAGEPGNRGSSGFREIQPQGWTNGRSRPRRAGNRCENSSSQLDVSAGYTRQRSSFGSEPTERWPRTPGRGTRSMRTSVQAGRSGTSSRGAPKPYGAAEVGFRSWKVRRSKSHGMGRFVLSGAAVLHSPSELHSRDRAHRKVGHGAGLQKPVR